MISLVLIYSYKTVWINYSKIQERFMHVIDRGERAYFIYDLQNRNLLRNKVLIWDGFLLSAIYSIWGRIQFLRIISCLGL